MLEPGEPRDPETDRIILLGSLGTGEDPPPVEIGRLLPEPIDLRVGETYDFRWMPERPGEYVLQITTTFDRGMPPSRGTHRRLTWQRSPCE